MEWNSEVVFFFVLFFVSFFLKQFKIDWKHIKKNNSKKQTVRAGFRYLILSTKSLTCYELPCLLGEQPHLDGTVILSVSNAVRSFLFHHSLGQDWTMYGSNLV